MMATTIAVTESPATLVASRGRSSLAHGRTWWNLTVLEGEDPCATTVTETSPATGKPYTEL